MYVGFEWKGWGVNGFHLLCSILSLERGREHVMELYHQALDTVVFYNIQVDSVLIQWSAQV